MRPTESVTCRDQPGRVVGERERLARGVGQAGQQAARVAGGDAVAVGVLDVVEAAVGIVGRDLAVQFGQACSRRRTRRQRAVVAGLGKVAAAAVGLEAADRAARVRTRSPIRRNRQRCECPRSRSSPNRSGRTGSAR